MGNSQGGEDLRRVHTLMVSALENIRTKPTLPDFNESANTLEKLSILKAWALGKVFIPFFSSLYLHKMSQFNSLCNMNEE